MVFIVTKDNELRIVYASVHISTYKYNSNAFAT